jgi:hypothetical protein
MPGPDTDGSGLTRGRLAQLGAVTTLEPKKIVALKIVLQASYRHDAWLLVSRRSRWVLTGKLPAHRRNLLGALLIALIKRGDSEGGLRAHGSSRACCRWPEDAARRAAAMAG